MTIDELKQEIYSVPIPKGWREGQFVFNRVEQLYGKIARNVQFLDGVDCFYDRNTIDEFLDCVIKRIE